MSKANGTCDLTANWSIESKKIFFRGFKTLSMINADGNNKRDIPSNGLERSPKWSLDMKQIAFIDQDSSKGYIKVMNADGTNRTQIYAANAPILSLDWQLAPINVTTPTGAGASVNDGPVNLTFSNVGT